MSGPFVTIQIVDPPTPLQSKWCDQNLTSVELVFTLSNFDIMRASILKYDKMLLMFSIKNKMRNDRQILSKPITLITM